MSGNKIEFNPADWNSMERLMDEYSDFGHPFSGENEDGEITMTSIFKDKIIHVTHQHNGWTRTNIYHREDQMMEELFEL